MGRFIEVQDFLNPADASQKDHIAKAKITLVEWTTYFKPADGHVGDLIPFH